MKPKWNISFHVEEAVSLDAKTFFPQLPNSTKQKKKKNQNIWTAISES